MQIDREVDRLIDERPGPELLVPVYDDPAFARGMLQLYEREVHPFLSRAREAR